MNTTYDDIRDRFISLITDFDLLSLTEAEINTIVEGYMESAIARFHDCNKDLENRDDSLRTFNIQLSGLEKEILTHYMILAWLSPQILHQQKLQMQLGTRDYRTYSPANQLNAMTELQSRLKSDVTQLCNEYYFIGLIEGDVT